MLHPRVSDKYVEFDNSLMKGSLKGRLNKYDLAKSRGLDAVTEAVVNSMQALSGCDNGRITIRACRDSSQRTLDGDHAWISSFQIEDNGPGFNKYNLDSFDTLDSTYKESFGCKGIGRLAWLRVFESATIDSVFMDDNGGFRHIKFEFKPEHDDYGNIGSEICDGPLKTVITLNNCHPKYRESIDVMPQTLAKRILNNCFAEFVLGDAPEIVIDYDGKDPESVNLLFEECRENITTDTFEIECAGEQESKMFRITHVRFYDWSDPGNRIEYCANNRAVRSEKYLPNIDMIDENGKKFTYCAYVSGDYLDEKVNDERTDFTIQRQRGLFDDSLSFDEIESRVDQICRGFLEPYMTRDTNIRRKLLDDTIEKHPDVAIVMRHYPNIIDSIDSKDSLEDVYTMLNSKASEIESKTIFRLEKSKEKRIPFPTSEDANNMLSEIEEVFKNNLTKYVLHRKRIIEIFEDGLNRDWSGEGDGKYQKEEYIHDVLLPRKSKVGDIIDVENCNLWMIDERLNLYAFTSAFSDIQMKLIIKEREDGTRPDLFVFSEQHQGKARSVSIIELKRPDRTDEEVYNQVLDYTKDLRKSTIDTPSRKVRVADDAVLNIYILCDLTAKGAQDYYERNDLKRSHDGTRYYRWHENYGIHIEVIDYTKLSDDATIRNQVFFDILNVKVECDDPSIAEYHKKHEDYRKEKKNESEREKE